VSGRRGDHLGRSASLRFSGALCLSLLGLSALGCGGQAPGELKPEERQELRVEVAELLIQARSYDEAAPILRAALSRSPRDPRLHMLLGVTLRDKGVYREAERSLREAIKLQPLLAEAQGELGVLLSLTGRHELAIQAHQRSIELNDQVARSHNNLGFSYALMGQHELAITAFERALRLAPTDKRVYVNLGFSLGALKRDEEARRMLSQALSSAEVWHNLGLIYLKRGERGAAEIAYQRALDEDPRLSLAREALQALRAQGAPAPSRQAPPPPELPSAPKSKTP